MRRARGEAIVTVMISLLIQGGSVSITSYEIEA